MLIFISLLILTIAGLTACGTPHSLFNLETTLSSGKLQLWLTVVKAFGIPFSLLLLRLTKNTYVKLATALWGMFLSFTSFILLFKITELAPSTNLYGVLFVITVLICAASVTLISMIELSKVLNRSLKKTKKVNAPLSTSGSSEIERAYQTPTNPS